MSGCSAPTKQTKVLYQQSSLCLSYVQYHIVGHVYVSSSAYHLALGIKSFVQKCSALYPAGRLAQEGTSIVTTTTLCTPTAFSWWGSIGEVWQGVVPKIGMFHARQAERTSPVRTRKRRSVFAWWTDGTAFCAPVPRPLAYIHIILGIYIPTRHAPLRCKPLQTSGRGADLAPRGGVHGWS